MPLDRNPTKDDVILESKCKKIQQPCSFLRIGGFCGWHSCKDCVLYQYRTPQTIKCFKDDFIKVLESVSYQDLKFKLKSNKQRYFRKFRGIQLILLLRSHGVEYYVGNDKNGFYNHAGYTLKFIREYGLLKLLTKEEMKAYLELCYDYYGGHDIICKKFYLGID